MVLIITGSFSIVWSMGSRLPLSSTVIWTTGRIRDVTRQRRRWKGWACWMRRRWQSITDCIRQNLAWIIGNTRGQKWKCLLLWWSRMIRSRWRCLWPVFGQSRKRERWISCWPARIRKAVCCIMITVWTAELLTAVCRSGRPWGMNWNAPWKCPRIRIFPWSAGYTTVMISIRRRRAWKFRRCLENRRVQEMYLRERILPYRERILLIRERIQPPRRQILLSGKWWLPVRRRMP